MDETPLSEIPRPLPQRELQRRRRLQLLLGVMSGTTFITAATYLARGQHVLFGFSTLMVVVTLGLWAALRRGAPLAVVLVALLSIGIAIATLLGMSSGVSGLVSLAWIIVAPSIALAFGGPRAGWMTLGLSVVAISVGVAGIYGRWLDPFITERAPVPLAVSLAGACIGAFIVSRAYHDEQLANIAALEVKNRELERARLEAEAANRAKSEFLATISHEIRTPLHGVTGLVRLLREEADPVRRTEELRLADQSAEMLQAVINDVLDFSKIEAGQLELEALPVNLGHELRGLQLLLRARADEAGIALVLDVDPSVPAWFLGDPTRLRQVLLNLLSNALKFTAEGEVRCRAEVSAGHLVVKVTDSGIGMSPDVVARLFRPFTQADSSTTRRFGGTGLGLVICKRLVDAMGGTITVDSAPGRGSCFTLSLPCVVTSAPADEGALATATERRRVLVVEDNAVNQVVVVRLLERLGHEVQVVDDGAKALTALDGHRFDLVLMDVHMPVMDGYQATRALRARGDRTPIVALTAGVTTVDRAQCLESGMNDVLAKPLKLDRLDAVLRELGRAAPAA